VTEKPIIMGEAPGQAGDPDRPLAGSAGKRLALMAGLRHWDELAQRYELMNLLQEFPGTAADGVSARLLADAARAAQADLWPLLVGRVVVVLGSRLKRLYSVPEMHRWCYLKKRHVAIAAVPPPSGLNRLYNSHEEREATAQILRQALELPSQIKREN
jgi:uracil-DNA glycosylase